MSNTTEGWLEIEREFGPMPDGRMAAGVEHDGTHLWVACGDELHELHPKTGALVRRLPLTAEAGTAFDGTHLYQLVRPGQIHKLDATTGQRLESIALPFEGPYSGLAWAEQWLWVGEFQGRRVHQIDPKSGAVLRTLSSDRFVTGVSWRDGQLWHATYEEGLSDLRRIDPRDGRVIERWEAPPDVAITGLACLGDDRFFAGGGSDGRVRQLKKRSGRPPTARPSTSSAPSAPSDKQQAPPTR